jgi:hypothetical protein
MLRSRAILPALVALQAAVACSSSTGSNSESSDGGTAADATTDGTGSSSGGTSASGSSGSSGSSSSGSSSGGSGASSGGSSGNSSSSGSGSDSGNGPDASGDASAKASRPAYNTGNGFFTLNGNIYDANGNQFIPMGMDTAHWDQSWAGCTSNCGIPNSGANINRDFMYELESSYTSRIQGDITEMINQKIVPLETGAFYTTGSSPTGTSCCTDTTCLDDVVALWVSMYSVFAPYQQYIWINIANEWGPANSSTWATAYESAITALRNAGYTCPLVIDSGGCGQDPYDFIEYGKEVYGSDPEKNVIFSIHIYGNWTPTGTWSPTYTGSAVPLVGGLQALAAAGASGGFPVMAGEFGPGLGEGPSPTSVTPLSIMQEADALGMGWLAWAWDDGSPFNLTSTPGDGQFLLTNGQPSNGAYPNNTDLSAYGNTVILAPTYGLFYAAKPASVFP